MLDEPFEKTEAVADVERVASWRQVTVFELFFLTTLVAIAMGVFLYVSEVLAVLVGGVIIVHGVARAWPPDNPIAGAVRGFIAATLIGWSLFALGFGDYFLRLSLLVFLPPLGYILGFVHSEWNREPSL
jgi:hypothetical protein